MQPTKPSNVKTLQQQKMEKSMKKEEQGHGLYQTIANSLFGGQKLTKSEKHVPQLTWDWKSGLSVKNANFSGPGTSLIKRLERGDRGITIQDKQANLHDLQYMKARNEQDIQKADKRMVSKLWEKSSILKPIESLNNLVGIIGIGGKILLDRLGVTDTKTFTTFGDYDKLPKEHQQLVDKRIEELEREGHGQHKGLKRLKKWRAGKKKEKK